MLTREENEMLTRVGPGTPAGDLLRRYWFPVGVASELTPENPTQLVRILGETLVLFLDKKGNVGLLNDRCPHRGASLSYGRVEDRGLSCPYHGWLFDTKGNCLETPAEPCESKFHLTVKQKSYPVQKLVGLFLGLSRTTARATDGPFRRLVQEGRASQNFYSASARL
jgi:phenylpropionate dioxygenase-like ring-hydroxylating dioxygenase large terminal subunit